MSLVADWSRIPAFSRGEFTYPDELLPRLLYMLQSMRAEEDKRRRYAGKGGIIITINDDYRPGDPGVHGRGRALDICIRNAHTLEPLPVLQQLGMASFYFWSGLGFYPFWNNPGLHVDIKPISVYSRRRTWWRNEKGQYLAVSSFPGWDKQ